MSTGKLILVIALWLLYGVLFLRTMIQKRGPQHLRLLVWTQFFLSCLTFTFTGQDTEIWADAFFDYLPVSVYVKFFCMIQIAHLYHGMIYTIKPLSPARVQGLQHLHRAALVIGAVSFLWMVISGYRPDLSFRYEVNAARDVVVSLYIIVSLLPTTLFLRQHEQIATMRLKHSVSILFCWTYLLVTATSLISLIVVRFKLADIDLLLPWFLPLTYVLYALFLIALMPHRWIVVLLIPGRLRTYWRLCQLQRAIARFTYVQAPDVNHPWKSTSLFELELAIYQVTISILDHIPLLEKRAEAISFYPALAQLSQADLTYPALVKELVAVRFE
jgi:hypothetical protein